jgi:hypothetical protein
MMALCSGTPDDIATLKPDCLHLTDQAKVRAICRTDTRMNGFGHHRGRGKKLLSCTQPILRVAGSTKLEARPLTAHASAIAAAAPAAP